MSSMPNVIFENGITGEQDNGFRPLFFNQYSPPVFLALSAGSFNAGSRNGLEVMFAVSVSVFKKAMRNFFSLSVNCNESLDNVWFVKLKPIPAPPPLL